MGQIDVIEGMREIAGKEVQRVQQKPLLEIIRDDPALRRALGIEIIQGGGGEEEWERVLRMQSFPVGAKAAITFFNAKMRAARNRKGLTQAQLGGIVGLSNLRISQIETFRVFPSPELAQKIAGALEIDVQQIFPKWLRFYRRQARSITVVREFSPKGLKALLGSGCLLPATVDPEEELNRSLLKEEIGDALSALDPDEEDIVRRHLGFDGNPQKFEEIAESYHFGSARASQIYGEAMRKLRQPIRSSKLRDFLYNG